MREDSLTDEIRQSNSRLQNAAQLICQQVRDYYDEKVTSGFKCKLCDVIIYDGQRHKTKNPVNFSYFLEHLELTHSVSLSCFCGVVLKHTNTFKHVRYRNECTKLFNTHVIPKFEQCSILTPSVFDRQCDKSAFEKCYKEAKKRHLLTIEEYKDAVLKAIEENKKDDSCYIFYVNSHDKFTNFMVLDVKNMVCYPVNKISSVDGHAKLSDYMALYDETIVVLKDKGIQAPLCVVDGFVGAANYIPGRNFTLPLSSVEHKLILLLQQAYIEDPNGTVLYDCASFNSALKNLNTLKMQIQQNDTVGNRSQRKKKSISDVNIAFHKSVCTAMNKELLLKELVRHLDITNKPEMAEFTFKLISTFFDVIEKVRSREDKAGVVRAIHELTQILTSKNTYMFSFKSKLHSQMDICLKSLETWAEVFEVNDFLPVNDVLEMWPDYEEWLEYIRAGGTLSYADWFLQRIQRGFLQVQPRQLWCGIVPQGFRVPQINIEDAAAIRKVKKLLPVNK